VGRVANGRAVHTPCGQECGGRCGEQSVAGGPHGPEYAYRPGGKSSRMEIRSVAVLGTGIMGAPMARNLAGAGFEVRAWNRTREKAEALREDGAQVADGPPEAVRGADAVITMLTDGGAVERVMAGDDGALAAMEDEALWLQTSTVGLAASERLAGLAEERGAALVDSPVLGTKEPAEQGQLIVLASGPDEAREPCEPVFDAIGSKTVWLGEAGTGSRMKLVVNSWLLALTAGLGETVALAEALDIDPDAFLETIDGSPMGVPYAQLKGKMMIEGRYEPSFPLALAEKDANLVLEAAERSHLEPRMARAVRDLFARADELGHGEEDMAAVHESFEQER
jgi:3-hydroxyisobutyrate dehydrogenase